MSAPTPTGTDQQANGTTTISFSGTHTAQQTTWGSWLGSDPISSQVFSREKSIFFVFARSICLIQAWEYPDANWRWIGSRWALWCKICELCLTRRKSWHNSYWVISPFLTLHHPLQGVPVVACTSPVWLKKIAKTSSTEKGIKANLLAPVAWMNQVR